MHILTHHMHTNIQTQTHMQTHTHHMHTNTQTQTHIQTHMHVHINMYFMK